MSWFGGKKQAHPEVLALPEATSSSVEAGPPPTNAPIDFVAVLSAAGVEPEVRERVVKAKQLLRSLPPDAPHEAQRQVVELAFQAFDIPTQKIIDGAAAEIQALLSFIQVGEEEKTLKLAEGERRIAELEGQIRDSREAMALLVAAQERRKRLTTDEIGTVEPIVQFFAHEAAAPAPVKASRKEASPKVEVASSKLDVASSKVEVASSKVEVPSSPKVEVTSTDEDPFAEPEYAVVPNGDSSKRARP